MMDLNKMRAEMARKQEQRSAELLAKRAKEKEQRAIEREQQAKIISEHVARGIIEREQQAKIISEHVARGINAQREAALYTYVSDVADPEARRELMEAIRATRELFLSEQ